MSKYFVSRIFQRSVLYIFCNEKYYNLSGDVKFQVQVILSVSFSAMKECFISDAVHTYIYV